MIAICLAGVISISKLRVQLLPDIEFPKLTIVTAYPGASPSEVEKLVTKYIEESVNTVSGVKDIKSESIEGMSLITTSFSWNTDIDMAMVEVKEKVDIIKNQLPEETEKSIVIKYDPSAEPILIYAIHSTKNFKESRHLFEKKVAPHLERVQGIALLNVIGGYKKQINVNLDLNKLFSYNIDVSEIINAIDLTNLNFPTGFIKKNNKEYLLRTIGEYDSIQDINETVIGSNEQGTPIYLNQISSIDFNYKERKSIVKVNNRDALGVMVQKEPEKNVINTCDNTINKITELKSKFPELEFSILSNKSLFIRDAINNVYNAAVFGGIIAFLILLFSLKNLKAPLIISTAIPVSILGTFALMYFSNLSINIISLGGIALGVGMMVDSGVVVIEILNQNNTKEYKNNLERLQDIINSTKVIFPSIFSSTITTIVVFLPVVFISGISGAIFKELSLTITYSLFCSLIVSITLVPTLYSIETQNSTLERINTTRIMKAIHKTSDFLYEILFRTYNKYLDRYIGNFKFIVILTISSTILGVLLFSIIDLELFPKVDSGELEIKVNLPKGTPLNITEDYSKSIENILLGKNYIENMYVKIGADPDDSISEKISGNSTNNIEFKLFLVPKNKRRDIYTIINELQAQLAIAESVDFNFSTKGNVLESILPDASKPLNIDIYHDDQDILNSINTSIITELQKNKNIINISSNMQKGSPELIIDIDRKKLQISNVKNESIVLTLRSLFAGEIASKYHSDDDEIPINVQLRKSFRETLNTLRHVYIKNDEDRSVLLSNFITISNNTSQSKIIRKNQSRVATIQADITKNKASTIKKVEKLIKQDEINKGASIQISGENEEFVKSIGELRFAFLIAIILIYMVLASQFQSYINPLIIMLSIPATSVGISFALLITGQSLNTNSGIGIIMLSGIVVNNSIVLFDSIRKNTASTSHIREAIIKSCNERLKPILITTFSTIFAMFPIAIGLGRGSEIQKPLAVTVIGGLTISTFLTLMIIPAIFYKLNKND